MNRPARIVTPSVSALVVALVGLVAIEERSASLAEAQAPKKAAAPKAAAGKPAAPKAAAGKAADQAAADAAVPDTFLVGAYEHAHHDLSGSDTDLWKYRVFAARFKGPLQIHIEPKQVQPDRLFLDDPKAVEKRAERAARAVDWSRISLTPEGVVSRKQILNTESLVVGTRCPICETIHWVVIGLMSDDEKTYAVMTNGSPKSAAEKDRFDWAKSPEGLWAARLDEGGYHREVFACQSPRAQLPYPGVSPRAVELTAGLTPRGDFTFGFRIRGASTVRLVGGYVEKALAPRRQPLQIYDEQVQYFAVVVADDPSGAILPPVRQFANIANDAVDEATKYLELAGETLANPQISKRERLSPGKVLILGIDNAGRHETQAIAFRLKGEKELEECPIMGNSAPGWNGKLALPSREWTTGGFRVGVNTSFDPETRDVTYWFLMPH